MFCSHFLELVPEGRMFLSKPLRTPSKAFENQTCVVCKVFCVCLDKCSVSESSQACGYAFKHMLASGLEVDFGQGDVTMQNSLKRSAFNCMTRRHSMHECFGKKCHKKGNQLKRLRPFNESKSTEN